MANMAKEIWHRIANTTFRPTSTIQDFRTLIRCLNQTHGIFTCLRRWWVALPVVRRQFILSMLIGVSVLVFIHIFNKAEILREMEDKAMDWVMTLRVGGVSKEPSIPIGWIDIDNNTYLKWNEPLYMQRTRLARLIEFSLQAGSRMVIVDIDLAKRDHRQATDEPIIDVLKKYAEKCNNIPLGDDGCPPVILLASLRIVETEFPIQRATYIDKLVDESRHLFWASPLFERDKDQIIRRWRNWESVRRESDSRLLALPSMQLLSATLLTSHKGAEERLQNCLDATVIKGHKTISAPKDTSEVTEKCCVNLWESYRLRNDETLSLSNGRTARRIIYSIPWQNSLISNSGNIIPTVETFSGRDRLLLSIIPAFAVSNSPGVYSNADLSGRVVFIGASFSESRDVYLSPIGEMPGVLILINALHSLLQHGEMEEIDFFVKLLINLLLILLLSIVFSKLNLFWAQLVTGISVISLLVPLSVFMFGFGYWLDFALPLLAVQIFQMATEWGLVARQVVAGIESRSGNGE